MVEKKSLDSIAKKYWEEYLRDTGMDEALFKVAMGDIGDALKKEDTVTPEQLHAMYADLQKKYKKKDLLGLRLVRLSVLRDRLSHSEHIGSIIYDSDMATDDYFWKSLIPCCQHRLGKRSILHFRDDQKFEDAVEYLYDHDIKFHTLSANQ